MLDIIITKKNGEKRIALINGGKLVEFYSEEKIDTRNEGNIFVGVVKDILDGMESAFVDIGTEKNSFIHLKDALEKIDQKKQEINHSVEINQVLKRNQKILVQVKKDSNEQKGARVSTHINLPSKYIVLMPNTDIVTVSQKIEDKQEQERLIKLVKENLQKGNGAVIRTSAENRKEEIIEDIKFIENKWNQIKQKAQKLLEKEDINPQLVSKAEDVEEKIIIDIVSSNELKKIIVNKKEQYEKLVNIQKNMKELKNTQIVIFEDKDVLDVYDIKKEIEKIKNRKIWLNCGGFITIDKTEALTAIDVNTGKYTGNKDLNQTVYKVNEEATAEIAKQIRLRDIGGIIIIDYIDMNNQESKNKIQKTLIEKLKSDRAKTQVEGFTKLDLMELTRKHIMSHRDSSNE